MIYKSIECLGGNAFLQSHSIQLALDKGRDNGMWISTICRGFQGIVHGFDQGLPGARPSRGGVSGVNPNGSATRRPAAGSPSLRIVRFGGPALTEGVESRMIDGISVRLTTAAKTVADCFKFRNKVGIAVAVEALRDGLAKRLFTLQELDRMARVCRVDNVLKPYLEALI